VQKLIQITNSANPNQKILKAGNKTPLLFGRAVILIVILALGTILVGKKIQDST